MARRRRTRGLGAVQTATSFTLGALVGGLWAIFAAPASGRVTRTRILAQFRRAERRLGRQLGETQRTLFRQAEHSYEHASHWVAAQMTDGRAHRHMNGNARRPTRRPLRRRVAQHA